MTDITPEIIYEKLNSLMLPKLKKEITVNTVKGAGDSVSLLVIRKRGYMDGDMPFVYGYPSTIIIEEAKPASGILFATADPEINGVIVPAQCKSHVKPERFIKYLIKYTENGTFEDKDPLYALFTLLDRNTGKKQIRSFAENIREYPSWLWNLIVIRAYASGIFGIKAFRYIDDIWEATEGWENKQDIHYSLTTWEILNNAYLGRRYFQSKVKIETDDPAEREALKAYKKWELDGHINFMRKGIDGFITTTAGSPRRDNLPYEIRVLEQCQAGIMELGARLAAGSPRVYVVYRTDNDVEIIRVSIDAEDPKILEGDEKDCPGADLSDIFAFIKKCHGPLMRHWNGEIDSMELWEQINDITGRRNRNNS